ncbi:Echinoderm microtubule-associated protein-like [Portunus trituberculatus]|uniref:Echinoderm microtubule-associated protein-like n=1 Tax=Portunus trituberculatus TaxID=210409 RepID=A0A5B7FX20_PORTR|nr:Echinoderm microtubule-associated protein-like [Portunus trituberculatus]
MALHPTRDLVASGQRASRGRRATAHVRVWHARSLTTLHVLGRKELGAGILAVAFSCRESSGRTITALEFTQDGDLITGDLEGVMTVWSVDEDGEYYAHSSAINALKMLSEGTVLSGGDRDRKIIAWDCDEDFEKITETRVSVAKQCFVNLL